MEDNFSIDQGLGEMVSGWFECFTFTVNFTSNLMLTLVWQEVLVHSLEVGYPRSKGLGCVLHSDFLRNWPYHLSYAISSRKWGQISNTPNICWFFSVCVLSRGWLFVTLCTINHQAPLSMGFSRQEYWSGLPFPPKGDLPNPRIELSNPEIGASLVAQSVKNLSTMQETLVWFLGWENPLEKEMATHLSILAWRILRTEEPSGLQSMGS